jgi:hypothetical protein
VCILTFSFCHPHNRQRHKHHNGNGNFRKELFHHWLLPKPQAVTRQMGITELNKKEQQRKTQEAKRF